MTGAGPDCLWWEPPAILPALPGDIEADVAVVGAGFTGLWTAYYLAEAEPTLRIVVLEAAEVGFGASGRNGGWCSALFPVSAERLIALTGCSSAAARGQFQAMRESVDEVGRVAAAERIDAGYAKGGTVVLARTPVQLARAEAEAAHARHWGDLDVELLGPDAARERLGAPDALGATYTPHCAAIHPGRLVRGLAEAVGQRGVAVHPRSPVREVGPGWVRTPQGTVRAEIVVRATEAYTARLPGSRRLLAPVYSLIIATEPLSDRLWTQIGLSDRETFSDHRHLIVYGQRTVDGRLLFGGRGAPYHVGSRIDPSFDHDTRVFRGLHSSILAMLPMLQGVRFTHAWGGPLGIPRDWCPSVGLDRRTGLAWAGGYVGDGVSTTNLAGRTLRDLIMGHDTAESRLPWVGHRSPRWEPEPLRGLGINAGLRAMSAADGEERFTGRSSLIARAMSPLLGH